MPPNLVMYKLSLRFLQSVTGKLEKTYISIIQALELETCHSKEKLNLQSSWFSSVPHGALYSPESSTYNYLKPFDRKLEVVLARHLISLIHASS